MCVLDLHATRRAAAAGQLLAHLKRVLKAAQPFLALFSRKVACHDCIGAGQMAFSNGRGTREACAMSMLLVMRPET